ncbi:MAG: Na+:solute symporter [Armatimonadetes bacterium]|nr:Na+:solute symporter [Armatimonadota bacterium]
MQLQTVDWLILGSFLFIWLAIGLIVARRAGSSSQEFFLSGRSMPWWLLGVSMVATTFSTDTPNLVTGFVRKNGVAGNWEWWAFLLTGMLTVFVYSRLWRKAGFTTDIEFYELRYSGKMAAFLRGFRALYLGVFFNVFIMATVTLAAIKIGGVLFGVSPTTVLLIVVPVTAIYSMLGGLTGVLITDVIQFTIAMIGSIAAAVYALGRPEVGGLSGLLSHPNVVDKLSLFPDFSSQGDLSVVVGIFIVPLAVQWWSVWYPGAEPGGGGYIAQRMLAAKDESGAQKAALLFNVAHYALRPWPWILVALASLAVFPDLNALREAFPHVPEGVLKDDLGYPAMLTFLPVGLMGLVVASLTAAYMSTISTHLNWGSSYVVNDFYKRFLRPQARERELVAIARVSTVVLMVLAAAMSPYLQSADRAFHIMIQVGAGSGLLFILRWFWWRVNPISEIVAMAVPVVVALVFLGVERAHGYPEPTVIAQWIKLVANVGITTVAWIAVTYLTRPCDHETLRHFNEVIRPGGRGWRPVIERAKAEGNPLPDEKPTVNIPIGLLAMMFGCLGVYSALFSTGMFLYGRSGPALGLAAVAVASAYIIYRLWPRLQGD